jgi:hypothetical protein
MKLKLSFYEFLGSRLGLPGTQIPPPRRTYPSRPVIIAKPGRPEIRPGYVKRG